MPSAQLVPSQLLLVRQIRFSGYVWLLADVTLSLDLQLAAHEDLYGYPLAVAAMLCVCDLHSYPMTVLLPVMTKSAPWKTTQGQRLDASLLGVYKLASNPLACMREKPSAFH